MSAAAIPPAIAPKVGSLVRMLASPVDGEVVAAARALDRVLRKAGIDLHALAEAVERPTRADPTRRPRKPRADRGHIDWAPSYRREVREALERGLVRLSLTEWEQAFVTNIIDRLRDPRGRLTFRQAEIVDRLVAKVEASR